MASDSSPTTGKHMASLDEQILRTAKEIVVKFIEVGRVSPTTFDEFFRAIYNTVYTSVHDKRSSTAYDDRNARSD
jgi:hypothetical protein